MKVSTRTRYGLRFLVYLAANESNTLIHVNEVAKHEKIPLKYLEQIIRPLKKAGMLKVIRGAKGGYSMGRNPDKINVKEIFNLLEGDTHLLKCLEGEKSCEREKLCSTYDFWDNFNKVIDDYLEGVSLADIVKIQREKSKDFMFYI